MITNDDNDTGFGGKFCDIIVCNIDEILLCFVLHSKITLD